MHVNDLLKTTVEAGASDLHLKVGTFPMMRVRGNLMPVTQEKRLDHEDVVAMSAAIMSTNQRQKFKETQEVDLAYSVAGLGRFRCNIFQQRGTVGLVLRVIPMTIRTIDELGLTVRETVLPREALYLADEAFFCGTAAEVTPIRSVDRITVGAGRRGPITERLQRAFFDIVTGEAPDRHGWLTFVYPKQEREASADMEREALAERVIHAR